MSEPPAPKPPDVDVERPARLLRGAAARRLATALVFLGGAVAGAGTTMVTTAGSAGPPAAAARTETSPAYGLPLPAIRPVAAPRRPAPAGRTPEPAAPPLGVTLPSIGVRSPLIGLRLNLDGTVQVPERYDVAGWYREGPAPGDPGAALLLGHVDSKTGPGIFYKLDKLRPGDPVLVSRADGTTARFVVYRLATYPKARFPASSVYTGTGRELRLITCTGRFAHGHYLSNLVVYARQLVTPAKRPVHAKAVARAKAAAHAKTAAPLQRPAVAKPAAAAKRPVQAPVTPPVRPSHRPPL